MRKKIAKQLEYEGLGFQLVLLNVPMVEIRGVEVPNIDYNLLQKNVFFALSQKSYRLTGNEIRFIRQYLQMTYAKFAHTIGVTHPSVIHWEKSGDFFPKMSISTELCIRLYMLMFLGEENKSLKEAFEVVSSEEFKLIKPSSEGNYLTLNIKKSHYDFGLQKAC